MHARLYAQIRRRLFFPAHGTHVYRHWQCHTPRSPLWHYPQNRKYIVKGTEPRLKITHIENFVKFGLVIRFEARVQLNIGFAFESAHRMDDFTDFRQPNFTKFEYNTSIGVAMNLFGTDLWNYPTRVRFAKKTQKSRLFQRIATSGRHYSAMIIDRRKFVAKWFLWEMSNFHFYCWNQLNSSHSPGLYSPYKKHPSEFSATTEASWRHTAHNANAGSEVDRLLSHVTCPSWQKIEM